MAKGTRSWDYLNNKHKDQTDNVELFNDIIDYLDGKIDSPELGKSAYWSKFYEQHGALVEVRHEAYCDVKIYEDGYEERYYIGD